MASSECVLKRIKPVTVRRLDRLLLWLALRCAGRLGDVERRTRAVWRVKAELSYNTSIAKGVLRGKTEQLGCGRNVISSIAVAGVTEVSCKNW
jgi:hypothetical protein